MSVVTVDVRLTQITGDRLFANERTLDQCKYLDIFMKNKACLQQHRQLIWCFVVVVVIYIQSNLCLRDKYSAVY